MKEKFGKRTKKSVSINVLLHSALWVSEFSVRLFKWRFLCFCLKNQAQIEIRDCQDNIEQDDEDLAKTDTHCPECGNFIGTAGKSQKLVTVELVGSIETLSLNRANDSFT